MLFALDMPDGGSFAQGGVVVGVITVLFNLLVYFMGRRDKKEETNADHFKRLLDEERVARAKETDEERRLCNEKLDRQSAEIGRVVRHIARLRRRTYAYEGRMQYMEGRCADAGIKFNAWTPPPADDDDDDADATRGGIIVPWQPPTPVTTPKGTTQ